MIPYHHEMSMNCISSFCAFSLSWDTFNYYVRIVYGNEMEYAMDANLKLSICEYMKYSVDAIARRRKVCKKLCS